LEAEYDLMAEEYDATREAPTEDEVGAIANSIEGKSLLDVGIGTGRFSKPLSDRGFEVTGIDVSRMMLLKARGKGLDRVLLADGYRLPFRDKTFDAAIIIHVLHVVADWVTVVREMGRVTRGNIITILRVPEGPRIQVPTVPTANPNPSQEGAYPVRTQHRMWQNEQELKERVPPQKLERIRDETISIPVVEALRRLNAKRSIGAQLIPPEIKEAMMQRILEMAGDQVVDRRIVEDLAVWKAEQFQSLS
jgi:ubiquinone/menaquinone biosynthesis C-methylase UbiE